MRGLRGAEAQFTGSEGQVLRAGSFSFQGRVFTWCKGHVYGLHRTGLRGAHVRFMGCTGELVVDFACQKIFRFLLLFIFNQFCVFSQ